MRNTRMLQSRIFRERTHVSFAARRCGHGLSPILRPLQQLQELSHPPDQLPQPMKDQDQRSYLVDIFFILVASRAGLSVNRCVQLVDGL
jgi:hypothetical protein